MGATLVSNNSLKLYQGKPRANLQHFNTQKQKIGHQITKSPMDHWQNRVAVVTGASAGIGEAICKMMATSGLKVVASARRMDRLEKLAMDHPGFIYPYKCDVSEKDAVEKMFAWIESQPDLGKVDVCVANAGLSKANTLLNGDYDEWKEQLDVNVLGLALTTQLSIRSMLKHKIDDGQIVFISSMSGHRVPNSDSTRFYSATKFAVRGLLDGFRQELKALGDNNHIRICSVSPGLVETEFALVNRRGDEEQAKKTYSGLECLQAEDIAAHVKHVLELPKRVDVNDILVRATEQKF